jgi:MtN3 and saliva related transmembrane protein
MENFYIELLGYTATTLGVSMMLPQVLKMYKTKRVDDISTISVFIYATQGVLWTIYGILISSNPLWIGNLLATFVAFSQVYFKIKYSSKN